MPFLPVAEALIPLPAIFATASSTEPAPPAVSQSKNAPSQRRDVAVSEAPSAERFIGASSHLAVKRCHSICTRCLSTSNKLIAFSSSLRFARQRRPSTFALMEEERSKWKAAYPQSQALPRDSNISADRIAMTLQARFCALAGLSTGYG